MSDTPLTARDDDYTARLIARATHVAGNHLMIGYNGFTPYFRQGAEPVRLRFRRQEGRGDRRVHPRIDVRAVPDDRLAESAQRYRAIGADVLHMPDG